MTEFSFRIFIFASTFFLSSTFFSNLSYFRFLSVYSFFSNIAKGYFKYEAILGIFTIEYMLKAFLGSLKLWSADVFVAKNTRKTPTNVTWEKLNFHANCRYIRLMVDNMKLKIYAAYNMRMLNHFLFEKGKIFHHKIQSYKRTHIKAVAEDWRKSLIKSENAFFF